MARELSPTLEAQQKYGLVTQPYLIAKIRRKWGGVIRYEWEQLYSGAEYDGMHTAAMPSGDGSLIRLRVWDSTNNYKLYYQRIENPNEASDFSAWTYLSIYDVKAVASCAYEAKVSQFYINGDREVYHRESTDNGANWGSWAMIGYTPTTTVNGADAAYKPNGDLCLVWFDQDTLYRFIRTSGTWGSRTSTATLTGASGISIYYYEDWNIIGTVLQATGTAGVYTSILGDGGRVTTGVWQGWETLLARGETEPFDYHAPFVRRPDTTRLFFVESFTQEENLNHIWYSHMPPSAHFDEVAWLEPVPTEPQSVNGLCPTQAGSYAWLTNANSVYHALATDNELDITSKLLVVDIKQQPDIRKGTLTITINNTNGAYNSFARLGDEITLGIGYKTSAGNEYSLTSSFWITNYRLESPPWYPLRMIFPTGIIGTLVIEAQDAWDFLRRYKTRRTLEWTAGQKSVKELLQYFIARSGLDFEVLSASDAATNFKPAFSVSRSTTYKTIVKNLLKMIPDQLIFREAKVILRNPTTTETVDWTYHNLLGTALCLYRGRYGTSAWDPNRAEIWTDTFMKMAANWTQIGKIRDRLSRITTPTYPNTTRAGERAEAELRRAEILTGEESWLDAPTNCGLEPWDKIKITDLVGGVTDIYRRVLRIKTHWDAKAWKYHQIITLGAD